MQHDFCHMPTNVLAWVGLRAQLLIEMLIKITSSRYSADVIIFQVLLLKIAAENLGSPGLFSLKTLMRTALDKRPTSLCRAA